MTLILHPRSPFCASFDSVSTLSRKPRAQLSLLAGVGTSSLLPAPAYDLVRQIARILGEMP